MNGRELGGRNTSAVEIMREYGKRGLAENERKHGRKKG